MKILIRLILLACTLSACGPVTPFHTDTLPSPAPQEYQDFAYQIVWAADDSMIALTTNTGLYVYDTNSYQQLAAFDGLAGAIAVFSRKYLTAVSNNNCLSGT